jgi:radical SAM superfamily enzyme YgiQ (UPF0313 family)
VVRTVLINPAAGYLIDNKVFPPLGLLTVAQFYKDAGDDVIVIDSSDKPIQPILYDEYNRTQYGITCTTPNMPIVKRICDNIKSLLSNSTIILGGPHITVTGTAKCERSKREWERLNQITPNLFIGPITKNQNSIIPLRSAIDMESYHYTIDGEKATSLIAQTGCPYQCGFCSGRNSDHYRSASRKPVEMIMAEIDQLYWQGYRGFMFYDDEINLNKREFHSLLHLLIEYQNTHDLLSLRGFSRADLLTKDEATLMRAAGFKWLLVGFESGSDKMLRAMNKKINVEQNTRAIDIARRAGLKVKALMSIGHPGESPETIEETRRWIKAVLPDDFDITIVSIYPGAPYYEESVLRTGVGDVWVYEKDGELLYSRDIDFMSDDTNYKGKPGEYKCHVWTPYLAPEDLITIRDELEKELRC